MATMDPVGSIEGASGRSGVFIRAGGLVMVLAALVVSSPAWAGDQKAYVEKVSDGEPVKVRLLPGCKRAYVRLLGIDCPESHKNEKCRRDGRSGRPGCSWQVPWGKKAKRD